METFFPASSSWGKCLEFPLTLGPEVSVSHTCHMPRSQRVHMGSVDSGTQKSPNSSSVPQTPYFFHILSSFQRTCDISGFCCLFPAPFLVSFDLALKFFNFFLKFLSPISSHSYLIFFFNGKPMVASQSRGLQHCARCGYLLPAKGMQSRWSHDPWEWPGQYHQKLWKPSTKNNTWEFSCPLPKIHF